ncbi:MAG: hypothetical protein EOO50_05195 [Flavobacterium sp.]|uniref:hypothetical protein n=1 Tax=Flavobacterium sp. TaxID=239 RepID=UPI001207257D|nr:hypothetical protein [Flavobacterium sp.]RZJ67679.1 MAG: hypothetical protein EOO50_05195 [Flavobacterium sp.]
MPPNKKGLVEQPFKRQVRMNLILIIMTKLNKNFDNIETLCQRDFDVQDTLNLLIMTNGSIYMSWGVERKISYKGKGLLLYVNGHLHTGWVLVVLAWNDTYSFYLLEGTKEIKHEEHELYFDVIQQRLDIAIEKQSNYNF